MTSKTYTCNELAQDFRLSRKSVRCVLYHNLLQIWAKVTHNRNVYSFSRASTVMRPAPR